jgi:Uma2 family endonuclease
MATSTQVTVEEYLRTSYDPDREYVDGEVLDRNVGRKRHSKVQACLISFLMAHATRFGIFTLPEWRMCTGETRYRIPDVVIVAGPEPDEEVLSTPPLVCIEVLSPEDRMSRVLNKVAEYLTFGVRYVWVLNPESNEAFVYTATGMEKITDGFLRTENPAIEIPLDQIFD